MEERLFVAAFLGLFASGCYGAAPETGGDYTEEPVCVTVLDTERIVCPDEAPFAVCFFTDPDLTRDAECNMGLMPCQTFTDHGEVRGENVCCVTPDCL